MPMPPKDSTTATLLVSCDDRPGLVAALSQLLFALGLSWYAILQMTMLPWMFIKTSLQHKEYLYPFFVLSIIFFMFLLVIFLHTVGVFVCQSHESKKGL